MIHLKNFIMKLMYNVEWLKHKGTISYKIRNFLNRSKDVMI